MGKLNVGLGMPIFVFVFKNLNPDFIFKIKNWENIFGHKSMLNKSETFYSKPFFSFLKCSKRPIHRVKATTIATTAPEKTLSKFGNGF